MVFAPIILFVYNRPWHTRQTVEVLQKNDSATESELFIFADGPKTNATEEQKEKIRQVREYIHKINGFKSITICEKETNQGLANSVIAGVTEIINKFGKAIVVEDDLVTSRYFLKFMNEALDFFENDERIFSVSGYTFPSKTMKIPTNYKKDIYLSYRHGSWGWGTWIGRWNSVDWEVTDFKEFSENIELQKAFNRGGADMSGMLKAQMEGKIDSWAIRFDYSLFKQNKFNIRPVKSLVTNVGLDNSGTHTGADEKLDNILDDNFQPRIETIEPDNTILKNFRKVFDPPPRYSLKRFIGKVLKRLFS
ncbi:glycosyltransferase [bacterium]|nr:glycosyltransferase [bacterium]